MKKKIQALKQLQGIVKNNRLLVNKYYDGENCCIVGHVFRMVDEGFLNTFLYDEELNEMPLEVLYNSSFEIREMFRQVEEETGLTVDDLNRLQYANDNEELTEEEQKKEVLNTIKYIMLS